MTGVPGRMPSRGGVTGEFVNQRFASCRRDLAFSAHAYDFGLIRIRDDETGRVWQKIGREVFVHSPEVAVTPFEIALPLPVAREVLAAGLAFDDPDFRFGTEPHDIDTQAGPGHQFNDRNEVKAGKVPTDTACQKLSGLGLGLINRHFQMGGQIDANGKPLLPFGTFGRVQFTNRMRS